MRATTWTGRWARGVDATYAQSFVNFVNAFKTAMPAGMTLSADAILSNVNGCYCSGNDGYLDFGLLSGSSIDRVIIENYNNELGTASTSCQTATLSSANPALCPVDAQNNQLFVGTLNYMCSNLPAGMVVIGVESNSGGTNRIAGQAISTMEAYGMDKIAVWPQVESGYPYLSGNGLVASQSTWYAVLAAFLQN